MVKWIDSLAHGFNAFTKREKVTEQSEFWSSGPSYSTRPDRPRLSIGNERSIIAAIYTRIAIDVAQTSIKHVKLDDNDRYVSVVNSGLNTCLTLEANIDQGARMFKQHIVTTMLDKGVSVIVPVDADLDPEEESSGFDIQSMRVGEVVEWKPTKVKVLLYNDRKGERQEIWVDKKTVAIIENPLYAVMNEPNSTSQRINRKLNMLDAVDEASSSGKLDLIVQLPYVLKGESKKQQAALRRDEIEVQLKGSKYGIAYTDGTEKITQLNRPAENNLLKQIEFLTDMLYGQLGITSEVMNGNASEAVMLNYHNRTIEPILTSITESFKRAFLTKNARTRKHSVEYFRDPFKLVAISSIADIADKFTRNEILTANEVRGIVGFMPSTDKKADQLHNSNMPIQEEVITERVEEPV